MREVYLPWSKANKRSWHHDSRYCEVICAYFANRTFGDITPMLIEHFKKHRREGITQRGTTRNMATVNRELAQLSKIFSLAVDNGYCKTNPCRKVRRFRVDNRRERVLGSEETDLLAVLTGTLSQKFGGAATTAGVAGVTLHTLRHTFATRLKDAGVDPFTVRDLLGHATLEMTGRYTHATEETMRRGVEILGRAAQPSARIVPSRQRGSA